MSYSIVDPILEAWADSHSLHIHTQYQDAEVRSIDIVSPQGKRFQLWIDEPSRSGDISVHIWDMKKRRQDYVATKSSFKDKLEAAYQQAQSWF
ncbi:MAG TPA: hypothetical protein DCE52_06100 [Rhodobacteraceae bacterium]|nr:hypothetical protein [Paracoccaceae bacterium]